MTAHRRWALNGIVLLALACAPAAPAAAQVDLSGVWTNVVHEDLIHRRSMLQGDYTGVPINEAARFKAESWDQAVQAMHERQCIPHPVAYQMRGFTANMRIAAVDEPDTGRIVAYTMHGTYGRPRTIWMDGRSHPGPHAPHTWTGFSTGRWEGPALVVTTTHMKMGYILRNGVPTSDLATLTEHYIRHGEHLLGVIVVHDPVYLSEPFIRTQNWTLTLTGQPNAWGPCGPAEIVDELPNLAAGAVPHYLPGTNPNLDEFPMEFGLPIEAARGGARTIFPDFVRELESGAPLASTVAPAPRARVVPWEPAAGVELLPVQGRVAVIVGAGGNIVVQAGEDGVLLVDAGRADRSDDVLAAIRGLSDEPIRFIVNTHAHPEHTGGNAALGQSGRRVADGLLFGGRPDTGAMILAHEHALAMLASGAAGPVPVDGWPTDAYARGTKEVYTNGEGVQIVHQPGRTGGDSLVYFRRSDVVAAGPIFDMVRYPVIDAANGGTFRGILAGLNRILDLTIPRDWQEGGTVVVPARGRLADESDVVEYRDMLTIIGDRIADMVARGLSLDEVRAARPTRDYDGRWGATEGDWTTDQFIAAIYEELRGR